MNFYEPTKAHYHDADSSCLRPVSEVPLTLSLPPATSDEIERMPMVAVGDGWYRCNERRTPPAQSPAYYVHDHAGHFVSHYPRDKFAGCPA